MQPDRAEGQADVKSCTYLDRASGWHHDRAVRILGRRCVGLVLLISMAGLTACTSGGSGHDTANGVRSLTVAVGSPPLTATLTLPAGPGRFPAVVLVGGSGPGDKDETVGPNKPFRDIAAGLATTGIASLRYDKRTKDYPHDLNPATFTATQEYVPDAIAAIRLLRSRAQIDAAHIFVLGHSQGGTFAPLIAKEEPTVAGVILLAAAAEPIGATLVRQIRYLAGLPGAVGAQAAAELPAAEQAEQQVDSPALATDSPTTKLSPLWGGAGPAYFLDLRRYDELATARAITKPLLLLQGQRDYQVTVVNDLRDWVTALAGRPGVTSHIYAQANHLFIDGSGPPSPADYEHRGHVDPKVIADIVTWIRQIP
jgi:uncharacterized protein